ncbi:MAG: J domain-containing protein [Phycisphaerae bacterium]|nr:J domain-containing protein [Phycisphaerae bacterium]
MTRGTLTPYDVLGISPEASLEEIRLAYRRGALKYHPDNYHENPLDAEEKFRTLAQAYKAALRAHLPGYRDTDGTRPCSPADFARMDTKWHSADRGDGHYIPGNASQWSLAKDGTKSRSVPTVDENRVFVLAWAVATILGIVVIFSVVAFWLLSSAQDGIEVSDILVTEIIAIFVVTAIITAAIYGIVLTRKTIWLTLQLGARLLPFLPNKRTPKQLPRDASQEV